MKYLPKEISKVEMVFGGDMEKLLPKWEDIPNEFKEGQTKWNKIQSIWFFEGLSGDTDFIEKEGIDGQTALKHLMAIQSSWEPKHEHKSAAVAFLLSEWFEDVKIPGKIIDT